MRASVQGPTSVADAGGGSIPGGGRMSVRATGVKTARRSLSAGASSAGASHCPPEDDEEHSDHGSKSGEVSVVELGGGQCKAASNVYIPTRVPG